MFQEFYLHIFSVHRLESVAISMLIVSLLGMMFGPLWGNANPLLWGLLDKIFGGLAVRTYNLDRSLASLQFRGAVLLTLYLLITGIIASSALLVERRFALSGFMDPILLALTVSGGPVWSSLMKLHHALKGGLSGKKGSYYPLAVSSRTNLNSTDDHGIIRIGIGFAATSFDKALIAPVFWYLAGGLPAAYLYCGIMAARWSLSKDGFAKGIGTLALKLEMVFGIVPQIISALFLVLGAMATPSASFIRGLSGLIRRRNAAPYAEGGLPVTVMAYALNISLGGPVEDKTGSALKRAWVGPYASSARLERKHLRLAVYMTMMAFIWVFLAAVAGTILG